LTVWIDSTVSEGCRRALEAIDRRLGQRPADTVNRQYRSLLLDSQSESNT